MAPCNSRSLRILVLLFQLLSVLIPLASPISFNFTGSKLDKRNLNFSGDAYSDNIVVQLTRNQQGAPPLSHSFGSATYSQPVPLWNKASGTLANFTTNFRFAINSFGKNESTDGLAFFLSPIPLEGYYFLGGTFGLFPNGLVGRDLPNVVAVEFDSFKNREYNDSSSNHVGIDTWSVVSVDWVDLNASIRENEQFIASVSYNAVTQNLSVLLSNASDPWRNWSLFHVVDLRKYLPEHVAVVGNC